MPTYIEEIESSQRQQNESIRHQESLRNIETEGQYKLMSMLKPDITIDGDHYCVLYGRDLQSGIAGFGKTPHKAVLDFNNNWHKEIKK